MKKSTSHALFLCALVFALTLSLLGAAASAPENQKPQYKGTGTWNEESGEEEPPPEEEEEEGGEEGEGEREYFVRLHIQGEITEAWAEKLQGALVKKDEASRNLIADKIESLATIDFPRDGPALKLIADDYRADAVAKWRIRVYRDVQRAPTPSVYHFFEVSFRAKVSAAAFPDVVTYLATRVDANGAKKTITDAFKQDAAAISVIERR